MHGNMLFFETVRTGFPDADIHVVDNASDYRYRDEFARSTAKINGSFTKLTREVVHSNFVESLVNRENDDFYIIDPDTIWFKRMPDRYNAAMAGRLIPGFFDSYTGCNTLSRLHTSCLFLSPDRIKAKVAGMKQFAFNGFRDEMLMHDGKWIRYDTCGKLYHALKDEAHVFSDEENSAFAHLFCGTHLDLVKSHYPKLAEIHSLVSTGKRDLQLLYREQNDFFMSLKELNENSRA